MEMVTAVLSGARNLELRVFVELDSFTPVEERRLTSSLCRLMDRRANAWRRYVLCLFFMWFLYFICRADRTIWIEDIMTLLNVQEADHSILNTFFFEHMQF